MRRRLITLCLACASLALPCILGGAPTSAAAATFGKTSVGSSTDTMLADRKRVNRYSMPYEGEVTKLSIYLAPTSTTGEQKLKGVIYSDENGPKTLLATSKELTFSHTQSAGWYDLTFTTPVKLAPANYWIGAITGSTSEVAGFRWTSVTNSRDKNVNEYAKGPSNPFGTPEVDSEQMSLYATYTVTTPTCNKYVSTSGSDANNGNSEATAYRHVAHLLANHAAPLLSAGQTGCLVSGQTFHEEGESVAERKLGEGENITFGMSGSPTEKELEEKVVHGTEAKPVVITSTNPESPATIDGRIALEKGANWLTFTRLTLKADVTAGENEGPSPTIGSHHTAWTFDDISGGAVDICVLPRHDFAGEEFGTAENTLIEHDRVHGCGHPVTKAEYEDQWCDTYPLVGGECEPKPNEGRLNGWHAHSLYEEGSFSTVKNDYFYENSGVGVLLRGGDHAVVEHNVIDGNGRGVEFGDNNPTKDKVSLNIVTNSASPCGKEKTEGYKCDEFGVSSFCDEAEGHKCLEDSFTTNDLYGNTVANVSPELNEHITLEGNKEVNPEYENAAEHNYKLKPGSPVVGYGPDTAQP